VSRPPLEDTKLSQISIRLNTGKQIAYLKSSYWVCSESDAKEFDEKTAFFDF